MEVDLDLPNADLSSENLPSANTPRNQGRVAGGVRINSIITASLL